MPSTRWILGTLVRVVVFTPLMVGMYVAYSRPTAFAAAFVDGFDPGTILGVLASTPQVPLVTLVAAGVAVLGPYLLSGDNYN